MQSDILRFKGVVTARNKATGKILFDGKPNCVVENGRIIAMANLLGMTSTNLITSTTALGDVNPQTKKILFFKAGTGGQRSDYGVATNATDLSNTNTAAYYRGYIEYFDGTEVSSPADIPVGQAGKAIVNLVDADTIFARFKLTVDYANGEEGADDSVLELWKNGKSETGVDHVNELGLFFGDDEDTPEENWIMFSMLSFPSIPFFSNMCVEFEYRIYV